ncbi:MAG: T9SS type A sorting domain-containing protein, partial [Hymenobacteraceae bacterium]|nr:T9SS type A sorting domain-containing protein [Hymenobacteraceae bacterium]
MKSFRLFFVLAALLLIGGVRPASAQRYEWLQPLQNAYFESRSVTDAAGNTYVAGYYYDSLVTTIGTLHGADRGYKQGAYVAKINAAGVMKWLRSIHADSTVGVVNGSITLDGQGHLYLSGIHGPAAHFGPITMPQAGTYLAKYDTTGTPLWVKDMRFTLRNPTRGGLGIKSVATDAAGTCFLNISAAYVNTFEGFPIDRRGNFVSAVAKCSPDGTVQWVQQVINPRCNPNNPNTWVWDLTADAQGNCVAIGQHNDETTFGTGPNALVRLGCAAFVVKYTGSGAIGWIRSALTSNNWFQTVVTDAAGNSFVGGHAIGGPLLDSLPVAEPGACLLKLDPAGTPLWLRQETGDPNAYYSTLVVEEASGAVLAAGIYSRDCAFGPHRLISTGTGNTFIVRHDAQGTPQWAMATAGGLKAGVYPWSLTLDGAGSAYLTGSLSETFGEHFALNFGPFSYGNTDASDVGSFVVKLSQQVNRLAGLVYLDADGNGQRDATELTFPQSVELMEMNQRQLASSGAKTGQFTAYVGTGNYDLRLARVPRNYQLTEGRTGYQSSFAGLGQTDSVWFGLTPVAGQQDARVTLTAYRPSRRGIPTRYRVRVENPGTTPIAAGQATVQIDAAATIVGSVPPPTQAQGQTRGWRFTDLAPFATRDYDITVNLPLNVPVGTALSSAARVTADSGADVHLLDNADTLRQTVIGSFDPNDISVNYTRLTQEQIATGQPLDYVVRFENMGTDTAFAVIIQDTLPVDLLQLGTVELTSQSHDVEWMLSGTGLLTMRFPGIRLPHRAVNAVRSQGFVRFRVVPRPTLTAGALIPNRAHIIFDFNAPMATNEAITLVLTPNGLVAAEVATWSLYPNPATTRVTLTADLPAPGAVTVTVFDALGRAARTETVAASAGPWQHDVATAGQAPGVYAVRLTL